MLIIHETPTEIIEAYAGDIDSMQAADAQIEAKGCWGYVDENGNVNLFYTDWAEPEDLIELLAHEITHERYDTVLQAKGEEAVCCAVAAVCARAFRHLERIGRV